MHYESFKDTKSWAHLCSLFAIGIAAGGTYYGFEIGELTYRQALIGSLASLSLAIGATITSVTHARDTSEARDIVRRLVDYPKHTY